MEIENNRKLTIKQIQQELLRNTTGLSTKLRKEKLIVRNSISLKAVIVADNDSVSISVRQPLAIAILMAGGAVGGVLYGGIFWGFGAAIGLGFIAYYLFFKTKIEEFITKIIRAINVT
jgi:hypothetical protein